jgi:hypothetical protein
MVTEQRQTGDELPVIAPACGRQFESAGQRSGRSLRGAHVAEPKRSCR